MDKHVKDTEPLVRYLVPKRHFKPIKNEPGKFEITAKAFFPSFRTGALSVYRVEELSDSDIWSIADNYVAPKLQDFNGTFNARADIATEAVRKYGLDVVPETTPHERHADIINWGSVPSDPDSKEQRDEVRALWPIPLS